MNKLNIFMWVLGHFGLLKDVVTLIVTGVEEISQYVKMTAADKKKAALDLLNQNLETLLGDVGIPLPDWVKSDSEAVMGFFIDLIVRLLNLQHGHDWLAKTQQSSTLAPAAAVVGAVPAPAPLVTAAPSPPAPSAPVGFTPHSDTPDPAAPPPDKEAADLAQAKADFKAVEEENAGKDDKPGFTPHTKAE